MPFFAYQGRTTQGSTAGEIEAPDRTAAVAELRRKAILVTQIKEKAGGPARAGGVGGRFGGKVKDKEMAIFPRQFSTMVEAGSTLADALRRHPKTFDELYVNLVEVGEAGGILDTVLQRLSVYIEKAAALKRKVKSAMIYPLTIVGVAFIVVIFMLTFVIPTFAKMFISMGADLPLPTLIVINLCPTRGDRRRSRSSLSVLAAGGATPTPTSGRLQSESATARKLMMKTTNPKPSTRPLKVPSLMVFQILKAVAAFLAPTTNSAIFLRRSLSVSMRRRSSSLPPAS